MCAFQQITNQNIQSSSLLCHLVRASFSLRMDCRCSSVRRLLCAVVLIFITGKSFSQRYVLPNIHVVRAARRRSRGISSGMEWMNCAGPVVSHYTAAQSAPFRICTGAVSTSMANGLRRNSKFFFCASKSPRRLANSSRSALSLSAKCAFGNTVAPTRVKHYLATGKVRQVALVHLCLP